MDKHTPRHTPGQPARDRRALHDASVSSKYITSTVETANVPSAATVNLNYTTAELITITGTTTITGFTEALETEWKFVTFSGILILTHNATSLILPGAGNITTAAGDTAEFYHLGDGNWKCVRYTRGGSPPNPGATKTANVRLTLESGVPVSTTDQLAKTILYATPCGGNFMPIYNGTNWQDVVFSEISIGASQTVSATTVNGSAVVTGIASTSQFVIGMAVSSANISGLIVSIDSATQVTLNAAATGSGTASTLFRLSAAAPYDVFAVLVSGNPVLRFSREWTSTTARTDAISLLNGVYVNTNALTGSGSTTISASQATYLGTVFCFAAAGEMNDALKLRLVWNMFNRFPQPMAATEATDTWNYSAAAYQAANANINENSLLRFVRGLDDDMIEAIAFSSVINDTATQRNCRIGIGLDSTTVNSATVYDSFNVTSTARANLKAIYKGYPGLGAHALVWLERGAGTDTQTWSGDAAGVRQCGIVGHAFFAGGAGGGGGAGGSGVGTVTTVSVATNNGVSGTVATATSTPVITVVLGDITPDSVAAVGAVTGSNLSGTNTGNQTTIVGITGTIAQFNTACTDADFATGGGTATGTNTGDQTSVSGNAGTVTIADAGGDTTTFPLLGTSATGNLAPATDPGLTYNATTNVLTAGGFAGPLTGNVTGDISGSSGSCTGNAATVTTNANLTGPITSAGNATSVAAQTGTGSVFAMQVAPVFTTTITVGAAGGATGSVLLKGTTSGTVTIKTADAAGTYTLTLPGDDGTSGQFLKTDGSGILTWDSPAGAGTVTSVSVVTANGFGGTVATATSTPAITIVPDRLWQGVQWGLVLANDATDPTNDIGIAIGVAVDLTTAKFLQLTGALIKRLDATFVVGTNQGGLDTGAIGNATYFVWLIRRSDTGVVDVIFSLSVSAPTMPASYDQKCRIGAIIRAGAVILPFVQIGDYFQLKTPIMDIDVTNPGTAAVSRVLTVPVGIVVTALVNIEVTANGATGIVVYLSALTAVDMAPSLSAAPLGQAYAGAALAGIGTAEIDTDTAATIRSRISVSGVTDRLRIAVKGWIDLGRRG